MGVSRRQYAQMRGCSESAVRKAIATGRITVEPDGSIDPERADRQWAAYTDPAQQRGAAARRAGAVPAEGVEVQARERAVGTDDDEARRRRERLAALERREEALAARLEELDKTEGGGAGEDAGGPGGVDQSGMSLPKMRLMHEAMRIRNLKITIKEREEKLVDRERAERLVVSLARRFRDALTVWPARVSASMAAELGVEARVLEEVLERAVWEFLAEQAEVKVNLGSGKADKAAGDG